MIVKTSSKWNLGSQKKKKYIKYKFMLYKFFFYNFE